MSYSSCTAGFTLGVLEHSRPGCEGGLPVRSEVLTLLLLADPDLAAGTAGVSAQERL